MGEGGRAGLGSFIIRYSFLENTNVLLTVQPEKIGELTIEAWSLVKEAFAIIQTVSD